MSTGFVERILRPLSPDLQMGHRRRLMASSKSQSLDTEFTSSLPAALDRDKHQRNEESKPQRVLNKGSRRGSGTFVPPTQLSPLSASRQRSASMCSPRRSFLGGLQKRPATMKHASHQKTKSHSLDEPITSGIDSDLARIRSQLDELCEEDHVIMDRVNRLITEITQIANKHKATTLFKPASAYKRVKSDQLCSRSNLLVVPEVPYKPLPLSELKEAIDEGDLERSCSEEVDGPIDFKFEVKARRCSVDSTGSADSGVLVVVVTDTTGETHPVSSGSSQAEDDVFTT